jgi:hypothetical protein
MNKIKKRLIYIILLIFFFSLILITLGWYDVKKGSSVKILEIIPIQLIIPEKIRTLLKNTLFYVPNLQNLSDQQNKKLKNFTNIQRHSNELWDIASSMDFKIINSYAVSKKSIKTDKNIYTLKNFSLPFPNIITSKRKPVGYLEIYNDLILLASGNGTFFSIDKSSIAKSIKKDNTELQDNIDFDKHGDVIYSSKKDTLALSKIKTNFRNITNDKNLIKPGKSSIRDLLIFNEKILFLIQKKYQKIAIIHLF